MSRSPSRSLYLILLLLVDGMTVAYESETDVCAHALSCNARLSTVELGW